MTSPYVYVLLDQRKPGLFQYGNWKFHFEPFYVGKGTGDRCFAHTKVALSYGSTNPHKDRKIKKMLREGFEVGIRVVKRNLTSANASALETKLIKSIGRHDLKLGPLTNLTAGGEGCVKLSKKSISSMRKKLTGRRMSEETKLKISQSLKGKRKSQETKDKLSEAQKRITSRRTGWHHTDAAKRTIGANSSFHMFGRKQSAETIARKVAANTGKIRSNESIANSVAGRYARGGYSHSEETRMKISRTKLAQYATQRSEVAQ